MGKKSRKSETPAATATEDTAPAPPTDATEAAEASEPATGAPINVVQVAGTFIGEPAAAANAVYDLIVARLRPLTHLLGMHDAGKVVNVAQLQLNLTRLCASSMYTLKVSQVLEVPTGHFF